MIQLDHDIIQLDRGILSVLRLVELLLFELLLIELCRTLSVEF